METKQQTPNRPAGARRALFIALAVAVTAATAGGTLYWKHVSAGRESTDDAYTAADVAQLTSAVQGTVAEVRAVDAQQVHKGDVLVVIDPADARLEVGQAHAEIARARAQLAAAQANAERAGIDLKRRLPLADSGSISGDEVTRATDALATARSAVTAAQAAVTLAQVRSDQADLDLSRTIVRSPVDGVIARRQVELGERLQPSTPLMSVVPVHDIYVDANFREIQLAKVRIGQPVELTSDLYGDGVVFHGTITGFSGGTGAAFAVIPAQNATGNWIKVVQRLPVRIALRTSDLVAHPLRVGLSMNATVDLGESR